MIRILCISPHFPPRADSESFCGGKFALALLRRGVEITVLCLDPSSPHPKPCDDSNLWSPLKKNSVHIRTPSTKDRITSAGLGLRYRSKDYVRWTQAVIDTAALLHREKPYDLVHSRSLPMEAHIAGYWISRRTGLPWAANINDPWDWHLMPGEMRIGSSFLRRTLSNHWMRKTLRSASLVTYPSAQLRDFHIRLSGVQHESEIIPHIGCSLAGRGEGDGGFRMVHTGKLGGLEMRSPVALLHGIRRFLHRHPEARQLFSMVFVGQDDGSLRKNIDELGLQSAVAHTGRVSYERSLELISSAAVCVLVEPALPEGIFLPSKLADYLVSGKPVMALSPPAGTIADLARHQGIRRVDVDDEQAIERSISAYFEAFRSGRLDCMAPSRELIRMFEPDTVTSLFCRPVQELVKRSEHGRSRK